MYKFVTSLFTYPTQERKFPTKDDIPKKVYDSINWDTTCIGGSYALKQFTGDNWKPNDVDIIIASKNVDEFLKEVHLLEKKIPGLLLLDSTTPSYYVSDHILSVRTYMLTGFDKNIQTICINSGTSKEPKKTEEIIASKYDIPGCVSYTISDGKKIFRIPEKGQEFILTKRTPKKNVDHLRTDKYRMRGYEFY